MDKDPQTNNGTRVRHELRNDILNGLLLPGQKLNIRTLSIRMQVAPGAVREALSSLEGEGLVRLRAKKGFEVSGISESDFFELTQARMEIEAICLRFSIAVGSVEWERNVTDTLEALIATPRTCAPDNELLNAEWSVRHAAFHTALCTGFSNRWLTETRETLYLQSERYRRLSVPRESTVRNVNAEHRAIADAALARDDETALRLLKAHLQTTLRLIVEKDQAVG